ncbi:uncharacterized protein BO88DRAFT_352048, partial [Aspergillus vadensis CBS 113365]
FTFLITYISVRFAVGYGLDEDCQSRRCHYILRDYTLSGDILERAARSKCYQSLINWLIDHGASFQVVPGGIDRLCCEAFEQGDFEKFRWLFSKGACLYTLAEMVFKGPGLDGPRSHEARRSKLPLLKRALKEGARPCGSHEGLKQNLILRRRSRLARYAAWNTSSKHVVSQAIKLLKDCVASRSSRSQFHHLADMEKQDLTTVHGQNHDVISLYNYSYRELFYLQMICLLLNLLHH